MNIHRLYGVVSPIFRRKRMRRFAREIRSGPETTVLDVGGCKPTWDYIDGLNGHITLLNLRVPGSDEASDKRFEFVVGDATALSYPDKSFDVVFSNSVIEHVGDFEAQKKFAREVSRVGRALWIQTPARCFFIEPHLIAPFVHWFPSRLKRLLVRRLTIWGWMTKPTLQNVDEFLATIRLLNYREVRALFPDCKILVERFLGMPKSYVAIRKLN